MFIPAAPAPPVPMLSPSASSSESQAVVIVIITTLTCHCCCSCCCWYSVVLVIIIIVVVVVVVVVVGSWLSRVRELGRWTNASQHRAIAENGMGVALIRQHHYQCCHHPYSHSEPDSCVYTICMPKSQICFVLETDRFLHRPHHAGQEIEVPTYTAAVGLAGKPGCKSHAA